MAERIATDDILADSVIDDCWHRIGIQGDRSCVRLEQFVHCHNCDIYADAAKRILDRYPLRLLDTGAGQDSSTAPAAPTATESILIFRLGEEWLGLSMRALSQVGPVQRIHTLPHRRSAAMLGLSNLRGTLVACLSLSHILGLEDSAPAPGSRAIPRMLIIGNASEGNVVCPVDEIDGVYRVPESLLGATASGKFSRAIFQWQTRSVRLLDDNQLLQAITRNLA